MAVLEDDRMRWKRISCKVGKSEVGCKKNANEMKITLRDDNFEEDLLEHV